jgi:hypothetical protein
MPPHPTSASALEICRQHLSTSEDTAVDPLAPEQQVVGDVVNRKFLENAKNKGLATLLRQQLERGRQIQVQLRMLRVDRPPAAPPRQASSATIN